jgi:hypothetical protein
LGLSPPSPLGLDTLLLLALRIIFFIFLVLFIFVLILILKLLFLLLELLVVIIKLTLHLRPALPSVHLGLRIVVVMVIVGGRRGFCDDGAVLVELDAAGERTRSGWWRESPARGGVALLVVRVLF